MEQFVNGAVIWLVAEHRKYASFCKAIPNEMHEAQSVAPKSAVTLATAGNYPHLQQISELEFPRVKVSPIGAPRIRSK